MPHYSIIPTALERLALSSQGISILSSRVAAGDVAISAQVKRRCQAEIATPSARNDKKVHSSTGSE